MSQGLGITQRRLLSALYAAPFRDLLRWELDFDEFDEGEVWATPLGVYPTGAAELSDGSEFYLIAQLALAEFHHPTLRDSPRRSPELRRLGLMSWFSLNTQPSTSTDRDLLRSWRAAYRRAARSLTARGFIETVQANVHLEDLGQLTWGSGELAARKVVLARISETGRQHVLQRRAELIADPSGYADDLRRALHAAGFHDIAEPHPQPPPSNSGPRRSRIGALQKRVQLEEAAPGASTRPGPLLGRGDVVAHFTAEDFDTDHIETVLRAWHREEQRKSRELFGDNGIPLHEQLFSQEDIEELRRRLA